MKVKFMKRMVALVMSCAMLFASSTTAFASETADTTDETCVIVETEKADVIAEPVNVLLENDQSLTVPAFGTVKAYFDIRGILNWTLHVSTSSSGNSGAVFVSVVHSNNLGVELGNDWILGTNDDAAWNVWSLANGRFIVTFSNQSDRAVNIRTWSN